MADSRPRSGRMGWFLLLLVTASLACGTALAQVPVTDYVVIQPIDVCGATGPSSATGCAPFSISCSVMSNGTYSCGTPFTDPSATSPPPIGLIDGNTGINITRAIWLQAGIDVTFLPIVEYNNTTDQSINDETCVDLACTSQTSPHFKALSSGTAGTLPAGTSCKSNCKVPLASAKSNAINMFFVNSLTQLNGGLLYGFAWLNGNGIAIAKSVFSPGPPRFDTLAHEIGHNLNLDHTTYGAGIGNNVMTAGSSRTVPDSSECLCTVMGCPSMTGGALYELDVSTIFNCPTPPATPIADQLTLGNMTSVTTCCQQGEVLLSGFKVPIPQGVTATAVGDAVNITVDYPKFVKSGGRSDNESIIALVVALPPNFSFGTPVLTQTGGSAVLYPPQPFQLLNGNNGNGNSNCLKTSTGGVITGGPSIKCLEILFQLGTFTPGTNFSFTTNILSSSGVATLADLKGKDFAITDVFNDQFATTSRFESRDNTGSLSAASQFPFAPVPSAIVDFSDASLFPNVAGLGLEFTGVLNLRTGLPTPCTLTKNGTGCPPLQGGDGHSQD